MSVLVLGGAGYIGSHTVDRLVEAGKDVVVVDSLVTGHLAAVRKEAKFYQGDLADKDFMRKVFTENPDIPIPFNNNSFEQLKNKGFDRIWDCGYIEYTLDC